MHDEDTTKWCSGCDETKPLCEFYPHKIHGHRSRCKVCDSTSRKRQRDANPGHNAAQGKAWREKNPEANRAIRRRHYARNRDALLAAARARHARINWQLSVEEYDAVIAPGCAICGTHDGRICIDHDHATGEIRDALCSGCNLGLGNFDEDPERLRLAALYLERHSERQP